jgi:rod shape-determining protein MreD
MAYLIGIPLLAFLVILQSALLPYVRFLEGRPDLVLLAVVAWSLSGRWQESMVWGLIGGLVLDLLSGIPLGSSSAALILIAFLVSLFEERFWEAHLLMPLSVTLVASLVFHMLGLGTLLLMGRQVDVLYALSRVILPSTFLNLILVLPAVQLSFGLRDRLFPPEVEI